MGKARIEREKQEQVTFSLVKKDIKEDDRTVDPLNSQIIEEEQEKQWMEKLKSEEEKLNNVNIIEKQHLAGIAVLSELIKTEEQSNEDSLEEERLEKEWLKQLDHEEFEISSKEKV